MNGIHWPALCAGVIVGTYWARVLRLALKFRRRTGRAANFLPPERLGQVLRIAWYPTVGLWITLPFISAWRTKAPLPLRRLYDQPAIEWAAVALAALALGATMGCWRRMGTSWRMGIDPQEKTSLIVSGPYAYVRHPIYALSSVLMLATLAAVPTPAMLIVALLHLMFLQWEARREERHLVSVHGEQYTVYARQVGRFVPRRCVPYGAAAPPAPPATRT